MDNKRQITIGIALILLSGVAFAVMLIIPFMELESKSKVLGSSIAFVSMEVLFYAGGFCLRPGCIRCPGSGGSEGVDRTDAGTDTKCRVIRAGLASSLSLPRRQGEARPAWSMAC